MTRMKRERPEIGPGAFRIKTPRSAPGVVPIVVQPPRAGAAPDPTVPPSVAEACAIARAISPEFAHYAGRYDTKKYPLEAYQRVREQFCRPGEVTSDTLRDALLWKYGHLGKLTIPLAHERLIAQLQDGWATAAASLPRSAEEAFVALDRHFGGKTRFITVAFLVHLIHPDRVPIIDQHNFRAVNALMAGARPGWRSRKLPSRYSDIVLVAAFMKAILAAWGELVPESLPTERDLDRFLMMYGKVIKSAA